MSPLQAEQTRQGHEKKTWPPGVQQAAQRSRSPAGLERNHISTLSWTECDTEPEVSPLEERADAEGASFSVRGERKALEGLRERIGQAQGIG